MNHRKVAAVSFSLVFLLSTLLNSSPAVAFSFSLPQPLPGEAQSMPFSGSTVKIKGLVHQSSKTFINGRAVPVQPDGSFNEEVIIPLGETEINVTATDPGGRTAEYKKTIEARENYFFLNGIADGTLNFSKISKDFAFQRDGKSYKRGLDPAGKISYYATAKLQGKYLFKSSLDTDKNTEEKMFTYIDPDKYYPIYGDNSTVVYDANSQGKFYGLFEWDKSGAIWGNYQTQIGDEESKLLNYNRSLYGAKVHFETPKRTVYGDPVTKITAYGAEANQHAGHSELLATGGSLYYLRHRNILQGSEQVRLEVRDKMSGMTIQTIPQSQSDYEMKYDEGRIMFKKPVSTVAASDTLLGPSVLEGNPVYVVVNYEYKNQDAFPARDETLNDKTGGLRISQHIGDHVRAGVTYLQEEKEGKNHDLVGGDTTVKIGNFTRVNAEAARSLANSRDAFISYNGGYDYERVSVNNIDQRGTAMRLEANSTLGEYFGKNKEFLDLSGYWQRIDKDFSPVDTLFESGTTKYGVNLGHKIDENDNVRLLYEKGELEGLDNPAAKDQLQAEKTQHLTAQWNHKWEEKWLFTSEYLYKDQTRSLSPFTEDKKGHIRGHLVGERVQYEWSKNLTLFLGQQLGVTEINDSFTTAGFSQKLTEQMSVHAQAGAGPLGNSVMAGVERNVDANTYNYSNYTLTRSAVDGHTSITSFGSNTRISDTANLRRERQFVTSDVRGSYRSDVVGYEKQVTPEFAYGFDYQRRDEKQNPLSLTIPEARDAATGSVRYILPDKVKFYSKAEHRMNSDDLWQVFLENQGEVKLTRDFFLFGEYDYSAARKEQSKIEKEQVGIAFRPVNFDFLNALFKWLRYTDNRPQNLGSADGGFLETNSVSDAIAGEYALDLPLHFQFVQKLAYKNEDIIAIDPNAAIRTPDNLQAWLFVHRINYHLTNRTDLAVEYRRLRERGLLTQQTEGGFLLEATYQIVKNIAVGAGFNFTNFTDDLAVRNEKNARGFFLRLQGKY